MDAISRIAALRVDTLIARISNSEATPGAGSAGAVALALAAACASKAVAISAKHAPNDAELTAALVSLAKIAGSALLDADRDSVAFEEFIRTRTPESINQLVREEENVGRLIAALAAEVDHIEPRIRSNMRGDLIAARSLIDAARRIQQRNEGEALGDR
jgi:hypothetical protein